MTDEKPDAKFGDDDEWTYETGYEAGRQDCLDQARQQKTDLTVAGAILIALLAGGVGFVLGMAIF